MNPTGPHWGSEAPRRVWEGESNLDLGAAEAGHCVDLDSPFRLFRLLISPAPNIRLPFDTHTAGRP